MGKSWQGICLGASGLKLKNSDMHKIALLLLNNGTYEGKRLLNKEWISLMNTPQFLLQIYQIILRSRDVALIKCPMVWFMDMW